MTENSSDFKVTLYEDDEIYPFHSLSNCEIDAIIDCIYDQLFDHKKIKMQFPYLINDEEQSYGMLFNMDEKRMEKHVNKKIIIKPSQYGLSPWDNKVEILFEKYILST